MTVTVNENEDEAAASLCLCSLSVFHLSAKIFIGIFCSSICIATHPDTGIYIYIGCLCGIYKIQIDMTHLGNPPAKRKHTNLSFRL